jgi:hypothetical protein
MNFRRGVLPVFLAAMLSSGTTGCVVYHAVKTTGELAVTSVVAVGKTATAVVRTSGKVASSAITTSGSLTATSIESLGALAQAGMVTFVDVATGVIVRVPWQQGMTLYGAGAAAQVKVAQRAVALVRESKLVYSAANQIGSDPMLRPGDVVRLAERLSR